MFPASSSCLSQLRAELVADFPLAAGVEEVWNGSQAGATLVSINGVLACIPGCLNHVARLRDNRQ
jgi:hypothetical protein